MPDPAWSQRRERLDLSTNVGRSVEQEPSLVVGAHRDRRLGPRTAGTRAVAHGPTLRAAAVPLRKTSSRCRSEHTHPHTYPPPSTYLDHSPRWRTRRRRQAVNGPAPRIRLYSESVQIPA